MKKLVGLGLVLALFALASPAFSVLPLPYCWNLDQTSCSPLGATKRCTDGIWYDYVCVCRDYTYYPYNQIWRWDCPEVR